MAAPAAILILLPSVAMAAGNECVKSMAALSLPLYQWIEAQPYGDQLHHLFIPSTWVTAAILIWLIAGNSTRSTVAAAIWFACLAAYHALVYLRIDPADPFYQEMIRGGCIENSPRHILSNLGFAMIAGLLTWQRIRRQKTG